MYKIIKSNGDTTHDIIEYAIDGPEDIDKLPHTSGMGSVAIVISTGEVYMKNSKGEWVKI